MNEQSPNERTNRRKSGGRSARVKLRSAPRPPVNPCPPGQVGGQYRPLDEGQIQAIYQTALRLLAELGMGEAPDWLAQLAVEQGAEVNSAGRLCFPKAMIEEVIDRAPKRFVFHGRDPVHDFELGGDRVYFGTGGAAVQTLDLERGAYRPSTLRDLYDFARLIDQLENVSWFTRCCVATDLDSITDLDVNTAYAMLRGTTKPLGTSFTVAETVDPIIDMFDLALGGDGRFRERPFCKAHISPVISPMRFGEDAIEVTAACIRRGVPLNVIIAAQSGATAPAAPAGFLAQSLAETLAGLAMVAVQAPDYPVIVSNWPLVIDLRTGAFSGGGGESAVLNAASAQVINWLGLPSGVASSMSDAKAVDAQMGAEKGFTALATGLAGANMVYESAGMMAALLGASFEAFVLDDEMLSHVNRLIRGIEVNDETIGFEAICEAVTGEGHFLGSGHTMAAMERDYFYPRLADREAPVTWAERGAAEAREVARARAREILDAPDPGYLSDAADQAIRARARILLDP